MDKVPGNNEQVVSEKRKDILKWIKEHKNQLIVGGICCVTLCLAIFTIKNADELSNLFENLKKVVKCNHTSITSAPIKDAIVENVTMPIEITRSSPNAPFIVHGFPRRLPEGQHASSKKIQEAMENGITLLSNQTYVSEYPKGLKKVS